MKYCEILLNDSIIKILDVFYPPRLQINNFFHEQKLLIFIDGRRSAMTKFTKLRFRVSELFYTKIMKLISLFVLNNYQLFTKFIPIVQNMFLNNSVPALFCTASCYQLHGEQKILIFFY